jgi:hypothetical protein
MTFLNENGFSITSTLVATGLVGALALGIMRITEQGYKGSSDLSARQEIRDLRDEFYVSMQSNSCGLVGRDETLKDNRDWVFDEDKTLAPSKLYNRFGGEFKAGDQYGKLQIRKNNPFLIAPLDRKSPLLPVDLLPPDSLIPDSTTYPKKKGIGYYEISPNQYLAGLSIMVKKPLSAGKGQDGEGKDAPVTFVIVLEVDDSNKIIGCRSIANLSSAKEACENTQNEGSALVFDWDGYKCNVEVNIANNNPSDGIYETNSLGDADPLVYDLSKIPEY